MHKQDLRKNRIFSRKSCFLHSIQVHLTGITSTGVFDFLSHIRSSQVESGFVLVLSEEYPESSADILSYFSRHILYIYLF